MTRTRPLRANDDAWAQRETEDRANALAGRTGIPLAEAHALIGRVRALDRDPQHLMTWEMAHSFMWHGINGGLTPAEAVDAIEEFTRRNPAEQRAISSYVEWARRWAGLGDARV